MKKRQGWVKLYREMLDWEWYDDTIVKIVYLHILLSANWEDANYHGTVIKAGEFKTTVRQIAADLKISIQQVRRALNALKRTNQITTHTTSKYTIISIKDWGNPNYVNKQKSIISTNEEQTDNKQTTNTLFIIKEEKEKEEEKERENKKIIPSLAQVIDYCNSKKYNFDPQRFYSYYTARGWKNISDWQALADSWHHNEYSQKSEPKTNAGSSFDIHDLDNLTLFID